MLRKPFVLLDPNDTGGSTPATSPPAGDGGSTPQPQAGNTTTGEPPAGEPQSEPMSLEEARKLRSEAQALRKREKDIAAQLKAYQDKEQAERDAQLSELEREKKSRAELQARYEQEVAAMRERLVRYAVESAATKLSIVDPDAAAKLIDWSELEFDEDGTPKNAEKLLTALIKAKPWLVAVQQQGQPVTAAQTPQAPAVPAMNPGRTSITPPSQQPGKIPTIAEAFALNRQRQGR